MTARPVLLDLFCRKGGAGMGYHLAGFDVVGVDIGDHAEGYPFEFHQADALEFLDRHGHEFDAVHASPPCQANCTLTAGNRRRSGWTDNHADLIPDVRTRLARLSVPTVIENVPGSNLRPDLLLCGLMFGLRVFRHRLFELDRWTTWRLEHPTHRGHRVAGWRHGTRHHGDMTAVYGDGGGKGTLADWQAAMDIPWMTNRTDLAEAIPPAYTHHIGKDLLAAVHAGARTAA